MMLEGIKIVDLTTVIFGPYATQMLADLGAEVIKIESGKGDTPRFMGRSRTNPAMSGTHLIVNRGKRSITLDLKQSDDAAVLRKLIEGADIFVHNVRGRAIRKLGFGFDDVRAIKPDIIYAHLVGFGQDGPYADFPAYDDVIQAASGATSLLARVDGNPAPRFFPSLIADKVAGTYAAQAMLAALIHKMRTGEGQYVEVPMLECFTAFMMTEHMCDSVFEPPIGPAGYARQIDPHRQPFPTSDGHIVIVPYNDTNIVKMMDLLGDPDFLTPPPFDTAAGRWANMTRVYARVAELTPARTTGEWLQLLRDNDFPVMEARDLDAITEEPHLAATGFFRTREHPSEGPFREMRPPVRYSARSVEPGLAPSLGQHSDEIRKEVGL